MDLVLENRSHSIWEQPVRSPPSGAAHPARGRPDYFLRNRSSLTTSAPSPDFAGTSRSAEAGALGTASAEGAGAAGRLAAGGSAARSPGTNCRPNCTEGSKKLLIAPKGTTRRSG